MFKDLVLKTRSIRRFNQKIPVTKDTLRELVNLARCSSSGANRQPLKYIISCEPEKNAFIFEQIRFARKESNITYPPEGERPAAYIVILLDTEIAKQAGADHGIAAQTIMLGAREVGIGGCMIGFVAKDTLAAGLGIPERYQVLLVIALGVPKEEAVIEVVKPDGSTGAYWDEIGLRHVPKRALDDIIIASYE